MRQRLPTTLRQSLQIGSHVLNGLVHTARVDLFRSRGIPYPALLTSGTVRFKVDAPWPQPSPISKNMPYAVLHVAGDELKEFLGTIVARFHRQVKFSWLSAVQYLRNKPHLDCPDDTTFCRYMTQSVYTYFLTDTLDPADRELLEKNGISSDSVHKSDLAPVSTVDPFPGLYCTGSVCYFRETSPETFEIIGIAMLDNQFQLGELLQPSDGNSWLRAKMHVLQGATYLSLFVTHPKCHFPMDAVIAVSRTTLPKEHPIAKLLEPHMYLQLPLDYSVLHIKNGPGYNDPMLYYTAFSGSGASQYRLFEYSFAGLPDHAAFPPYTFGYLLDSRKTDYLAYLRGYYDVILGFVRSVVADVELDDVVLEWARQCAHYSRGFGTPDGTFDKEQLADRLAIIIWNCSVVHSADHREFYSIPMEHKPTRLRIPPPFDKSECSFDEKDLTQVDDRLRHYMWHEMYVRPWPLKQLIDVDYQFAEPAMQQANRDFVAALATYDASLTDNKYAPLRELATSIHW
ncbi:hypothetical protein [Mycobacterium sp. RTGN5]|uniref:hypothetical protein n=1 Tax=Mycobacterium sp. RTGN5 TaxID=3016522 RepID=UPI0029C88931|nr:hypothetical protein [Mycobacterium sp. RTGN5]